VMAEKPSFRRLEIDKAVMKVSNCFVNTDASTDVSPTC